MDGIRNPPLVILLIFLGGVLFFSFPSMSVFWGVLFFCFPSMSDSAGGIVHEDHGGSEELNCCLCCLCCDTLPESDSCDYTKRAGHQLLEENSYYGAVVMELLTALLLIVVCVIAIVIAVQNDQEQRRQRMKLDARPLGMISEQDGESVLEALPLPVKLRVKEDRKVKKKGDHPDPDSDEALSCCGLPGSSMKKGHDPLCPDCDDCGLGHLFTFRGGDGRLRQRVQAYPVDTQQPGKRTIIFAEHFQASQDQPGSGLQKEGVRLATFKDFPPSVPVSALRLAQAGFYYLNERDLVKCFSCGATYQGWQFGERPAAVHKRISPNCAFVRGTSNDNVPLPLPVTSRANFDSIDSGFGSAPYASVDQAGSGSFASVDQAGGESTLTSRESSQPSTGSTITPGDSAQPSTGDSLSREGQSYTTDSVPATQSSQATEGSSSLATSMTSADSGTSSMAVGGSVYSSNLAMDSSMAPRSMSMPARRLDLSGSVYPQYSQLDARQRSFHSWTATPGLPSVAELVTLGFFYAGYADCVRCFFCGIGLKSWDAEDIPAEVHARWRPTCEYLRLVKGDVFVDTVAGGGRNVSNTSTAQVNPNPNQNGGPTGNTSGNAQTGVNSTTSQAAPTTSSSSQGTSPQVPDLPIVQRARESGYTTQQIAQAIEKLRLIGMEAAIDVMLLEILTNLFTSYVNQSNRANIAPAANPGSGNNGGTGRREPASSARDADMQHDGPRYSDAPVVDETTMQRRHQELQVENARLRDMRTCQRCHERPVGVIFLPCGHIVACTECAPSVRRCLRCDGMIRATANVFFS